MATDTDAPLRSAEDVKPDQKARRRRRRRRGRLRKLLKRIRWSVVGAGILIALVVLGVTEAVLVTDSMNRLDRSREGLNRVLSSLEDKPADQWTYRDFERLKSSVNDVLADLQRVNQRAAFIRPAAGLNNEFATSLEMVQVAQELGLAVDEILNGLQPTLFFITEEQEDTPVAQVSSGERIVELLRLGRGSFLQAEEHLANAQRRLDTIDQGKISDVTLLLTAQDLGEYRANIQEINTTLLEAPDLLTAVLGLNETQTYLILAQNNDELRPSGGYISTYGWMTVRNGRILDYDYQPTTPNSPNPPTTGLPSEIEVPAWWIQYQEPVYTAWDAGWHPDFPATAEMAAWFYNNGDNPQAPVDGVIGIDIVGLQYLLEALGEVIIPGYDEVVTVDNFRHVVYDIRASGEGDLAHKRFVAQLYREILLAWQNVSPEKKSDVMGALLRALREKHLMLYFDDARLNEAMDSLGWSGAQSPAADHDYIMVADANLSANKSNRSIARQLTYDVEIQPDGTLNSRLTVGYDYSDSVARNDPAVAPAHYANIDYFNVVQVFVPSGSELLDSENAPDPVETDHTDHHTIFVTQLVVEYNSGERYQIAYKTPVVVEQFGPYRRYRLLLQKQPGTLSNPVSVQIRLPEGSAVIDTTPEPAAQFTLEQPVLEFRAQLLRDQWIEVVYRE